MERLDEALPSVPRRPPFSQRAKQRGGQPTTEHRGASVADRLLLASALLLVVSAAGLASGSRFEVVFLGAFCVGLALTLIARRMLSLASR